MAEDLAYHHTRVRKRERQCRIEIQKPDVVWVAGGHSDKFWLYAVRIALHDVTGKRVI